MYPERKEREFLAVIFDMDGVIFDSEQKLKECWNFVADKYQIPDIETAFHACLGSNREASRAIMLHHFGSDFPYDQYKKEVSAIFHERYDNGKLPLKTGAKEILSALREAGILVALASSTRKAVVTQELSDAGILPCFHQIICGDMVRKSKPEPDIFLKACEALQILPCQAYAIEDSYNGIRAAHAGGLRPIMVPDLAAPTEEMTQKAEIILPSLPQVQDYLLKKW